jgi:thiol-disulfide isomerase/thioredoxin
MTKLKIALVLVLKAFCLTPVQANSPDVLRYWNSTQIGWLDFDEGADTARESGKRMFVVFHTTWCPHCTRYRSQFFDPRVVSLADKLVMVLVDRDISPDINARYNAYGSYIPRTMVLDSGAELIPEIRSANPDYPFFIDTYEPEELVRLMTLATQPVR